MNLLLNASGRIGRRGVPIAGESDAPSDPLPQAFALTAIVITFGVTAFLLALAHRHNEIAEDDDTETTA
jgi:multicomponent Na+:H+ antiporter subunit C